MNDFKLDEHEKISTGFKIPDGYFDSVTIKVNEKLDNNPRVIGLENHRKRWIYAAAAVLVLALSAPIYRSLSNASNDVDQITIENYLAAQPPISEDILVDLLDKQDIEKIDVDYNLEKETIEDALLHNQNLEQYILN